LVCTSLCASPKTQNSSELGFRAVLDSAVSDIRFERTTLMFRIFRVVRFLFVLLFTSVLGPIVLVALIAFAGYVFFSSRRGR
jgi:hypothetical protein